MSSPLDNITETHEGPEPRILASDIRDILRRVIRPGEDDSGVAVAQIAERAGVSPRTVYRALNPSGQSISLDLGDRLCLASGVHTAYAVRLVWPNGRITPYLYSDDELVD